MNDLKPFFNLVGDGMLIESLCVQMLDTNNKISNETNLRPLCDYIQSKCMNSEQNNLLQMKNFRFNILYSWLQIVM